MEVLFIWALILLISVLIWLYYYIKTLVWDNPREIQRLKNRLLEKEKHNQEFLTDIDEYKKQITDLEKEKKQIESNYTKVSFCLKEMESNITAIPYMAGMIADIETYGLENLALGLSWGYSQKRLDKVKSIREIRKDAYAMIEKNKMAQYQLAYLLNMFPDLSVHINDVDSVCSQDELCKSESVETQKEIDRLTSEFNKKYKKLAKLQSASNVEFERTERFYVMFQPVDKEANYKLAADILVLSVFSHSFNEFTKEIETRNSPRYLLSRVYWNNGGHISFEESLPRLHFDKKITARSDKGETYTLILTEEKVEHTKAEINKLKNQELKLKKFKDEVFSDMEKLVKDRENRFSYFSTLLADYRNYINFKYANEIINKKNPALNSAEKIKKLSRKLKKLEKQNKLLTYQMEIYESEFPWILDFKEISVEEIEEMKKSYEDSDSELANLKEYISAKEYNSLPEVERYQLILDRYKKKHKSNWQIGISFERYIGYLYEKEGYHVTFFGAQKGFDDLGRDLIATRNDEILIIQCKYWNQHKTVHEKHIFQLFGTMFSYDISNGTTGQTNLFNGFFSNNIKGVFVTTCPLSDVAREFAERLNIEVKENFVFDKNYPCIKCNISSKTGEKIFHLPFDQQYDKVCIDFSSGEFYSETVQEAYDKGFRRAYRWNPNKQ